MAAKAWTSGLSIGGVRHRLMDKAPIPGPERIAFDQVHLTKGDPLYILFPLIPALLWRRGQPVVRVAVIFALFLASLAFAQWGSQFNAKVNYFFTPSRLWELASRFGGVPVPLSRA